MLPVLLRLMRKCNQCMVHFSALPSGKSSIIDWAEYTFKMKVQRRCPILGFHILQVLFSFASITPPTHTHKHTHKKSLIYYVYLMYIFILFV